MTHSRWRSKCSWRGIAMPVCAAAATLLLSLPTGAASQQFRKIGELELALLGVSVTVEPRTVVPKNLASAVRVHVRANGQELTAAQATDLLGGSFHLEGELSGPGLTSSVSLPEAVGSVPGLSDPLLLYLPSLIASGDYDLTSLRVVVDGRASVDVLPRHAVVQVIDQVLVSSVKTRALTLDEIRARGIVLDSDAYLGFEFTLGLLLESAPVTFAFPVVFDRNGVAVPPLLSAPPPALRGSVAPLPTIVPMLLAPRGPPATGGGSGPSIPLTTAAGEEIRIPSVLVIPGDVGYLKQFFSAQLFVADGAPVGSGLVLRDVNATVQLPAGADREEDTFDDPLSLPDTVRGAQPKTLPVEAVGRDGEAGTSDDVSVLHPGEQGQAEFLLRGEREGFHPIGFDIAAVLDGLPTGPVDIVGAAIGGVLVRNPYFDVTFTAPAIVRKGERFKLYATVTNIGQGLGNEVRVSLDASRMSGATLAGPSSLVIETLRPGDAKALAFELRSERTGKVTASYLKFDTASGATGNLQFTLGVGERGVPLSPDTLALPTTVDNLPREVVDAAMRILGQAWSVAGAPAGTLPAGVVRTTRRVVGQKALALAEAGLRVSLGEPVEDSVRDLLLDFYGPAPIDAGFDQLLRETEAGFDLRRVIGENLSDAASSAGGPIGYERDLGRVAASGPDFLSFAVVGGESLRLQVSDGATRLSDSETSVGGVPGAAFFRLSPDAILGLVAEVSSGPYKVKVISRDGPASAAVTVPRGDGQFAHYTLAGLDDGSHLVLDPTRPERLRVESPSGSSQERAPDDVFESDGPRLISAAVIGPETLDGASPFGVQAAVLFDRPVEAASAAAAAHYSIPKNKVLNVRRQLSGRIVFATLEQPEGPNVPTVLEARELADARGSVGPSHTVALRSRLEDAGAVVSGRVVTAEGDPVTQGRVTYTNNVDLDCEGGVLAGLSAVDLDDHARYEFRYVRRDACGYPFGVTTSDPVSGAARSVSTYVQAAGQRLVLDIALMGRGSVAGTVRDLNGMAVPNAEVVAVSAADSQSGGSTRTDGSGRFSVHGISVGQVTVTASKGIFVGRSTGRIERSGGTSRVDVTLNSGSVEASGRVTKLEGDATTPVVGAPVLFYVGETGEDLVLVAVTNSGADGSYSFSGLPPGAYRVDASLNTRDRASAGGTAAAGDHVVRDLLIVVAPEASYGAVQGLVVLPSGEPASGAFVSVADRGAVAGGDGTYAVTGIVVRPGIAQELMAQSADGSRIGHTSFVLNEAVTLTRNIALSGLGSAIFEVRSVNGAPLPNQDVGLIGGCGNPCGCQFKKTGSDGRALFEGLPLGPVTAQAVLKGPIPDVARSVISVTRDGAVASGLLQFAGSGSVSGVVLDPDGRPSLGAALTLHSNHFVNDGAVCGLVGGASHHVRTDSNGRFQIPRVNLGPVAVAASQPFFPTEIGAQGILQSPGQDVTFVLRLLNSTAGEFRGVVRLPDGLTSAGAGVQVTARGALPDVTVQTDDQGIFRFARIFPEGSYSVTALDPVTGGVAQERVYLRAGQDAAHDLRLKGTGSVQVRVVDGNGEPAPAAYVSLSETSFPYRTYESALDPSTEGLAVFPSVFEGPFSAEATDVLGRGGRTASQVSGPAALQDVTVHLSSTGSILGRFLKRDAHTPIPYGLVTLRSRGQTLGQVSTPGSGDVGAFRFEAVPAGAFELVAQDPATARSARYAGSVDREGQVVEVALVAQGLGLVQGEVTRDGVLQPAAQVDVVCGDFNVRTSADADGRYLVTGVPEGHVVATASLANGFLAGTTAGNLVGEGRALTLDVALRATGRVEGAVLRRDGVSPGPPSVVRLEVGGPGGGQQSQTTGVDGRFTFDRVPTGEADLFVDDLASIDFGRARVRVQEHETSLADVRLNGVGRGRVRVVDANGQVAPHASVTLRSLSTLYASGFGASYFGVADEQGDALFPEVLAGSLSASASDASTGLTGASDSRDLADRAEQKLQVTLEPAGRVIGLIRRKSGPVVEGADVVLSGGSRAPRSTRTGIDGAFSFESVPLGAFAIDATETATGDRGARNGTLLAGGASASMDIELNGLGTLLVRVSRAPGEPVEGVDVTATTIGPFPGARSAQTDPNGLATLPMVLAGELRIEAFDRASGAGVRMPSFLLAGETREVVAILESRGAVRGHVLAPGGEAVPGALVRVAEQTTTTDSAGGFELANLSLGPKQRLEVLVAGRLRGAWEVSLSAVDPVHEVDLTLVPAGSVAGVVRDLVGAPAPGLVVLIRSDQRTIGGDFRATTDRNGRYVFEFLPVSRFWLSVGDEAGNEAAGTGTLSFDGQVVEMDLRLASGLVQLPITLDDGNGLVWSIGASGAIKPGVAGMFAGDGSSQGSGAPQLQISRSGSEVAFTGSGDHASSTLERREIWLRQDDVLGLNVTRRVYVAPKGYFLRYLDVLENPGDTPRMVDVEEAINVSAANSGPSFVVLRSENASGDPDGRWAILDDSDEADYYGCSDGPCLNQRPPIVLAFGDGSRLAPSLSSEALGTAGAIASSYRWSSVIVPAHGRVAFLHFLSAQADRNDAESTGERLTALPPEALIGLSAEEAASIINFSVPPDLRSQLEPLPALDGVVVGRVLAGDRETPVGPASGGATRLWLRSQNPHYRAPLAGALASDGSLHVSPPVGRAVPRGPFELQATFGSGRATATGTFPELGLVDLTSMPGRTLGYSSSAAQPESHAIDLDASTSWAWRATDRANVGAGTPFFEVAFPGPVTVRRLRLQRAAFLRARIEVRDQLSQVLWSQEADLDGVDMEVEVPNVAFARAVRLVDVVDQGPPAFGDISVFGEGYGEPTGRTEQDVIFSGTGVLAGRLLESDGATPIEGSSTRLADAGHALPRDESVAPGQYRYVVVPPGSYTLEARLPSASASADVVATVAIAADQRTVHDVIFPPTGGVQGQIVKTDGTPASASVRVTRVDGAYSTFLEFLTGSYRLAALSPGTYSIEVKRADYSQVSQVRTVEVEAGTLSSVDFVVPPVGVVNVKVLSGGVPVSGASVSWQAPSIGPEFHSASTTDTLGRRAISGVPGPEFTVRAQYPGARLLASEVAGRLSTEGEELEVIVVLPDPADVTGSVTGKVRWPSGIAASGVKVRIADGAGLLAGETTTDSNGRYSYSLAPVGLIRVRAYRDGQGAGSPVEVLGHVDIGSTTNVDILEPGAIGFPGERDVYQVELVAGRATSISVAGAASPGQAMLSDPFLELYDPDGALASTNDDVAPLTRDAGLNLVPATSGTFAIVARAAHAEVGGYRIGVLAGEFLPLVRLPGTVRGVVVARDTGFPLFNERVSVTSGMFVENALTDNEGRYQVLGVPDGPFRAEAVASDGVTVASAEGEVLQDNGEANLMVSPHGLVRVRVRRGALLISDSAIVLESDDFAAPQDDRVRWRTTGPDGRVSTSLPSGSILARTVDPFTGQEEQAGGNLPSGGTLELDLALPDDSSSIRGTVLFGDGATPAAGAIVSVLGVASTVVDAQGAYEFLGLPSGTYSVRATLGPSSQQVTVTVTGGTLVRGFILSTHVLLGTLLEPSGEPVPGAGIVACGQTGPGTSGSCIETLTASDGSYRFVGLPVWRVCPSCSSAAVTVRATLHDGSGLSMSTSFVHTWAQPIVRRVDWTLPETGEVTGTVRSDAGEPVVEADVDLVRFDAPIASTRTDAQGVFRFPHVRPGAARAYAEDPEESIPGESETVEVVRREESTLDVRLSATSTVSGRLVAQDGTTRPRLIRLEHLDAPRRHSGQPWNRLLSTSEDGGFAARVPVGLFHAIFEGDRDSNTCHAGPPAAAEGELRAGEHAEVDLAIGSHDFAGSLSGPLGSYGFEATCDGSDVGARRMETIVYAADGRPQDAYSAVVDPTDDGLGYRTLTVTSGGLRIAKKEFVPTSGAFARTLTLIRNPGAEPASVSLQSELILEPSTTLATDTYEDWRVEETSSGDVVFDVLDTFVVAVPTGAQNHVAVVVGDGGGQTPASTSFQPGTLGYDGDGHVDPVPGALTVLHELVVPPGATRALLVFTISRSGNDPDLIAQARRLADLSDPDALLGLLPDEIDSIVNLAKSPGDQGQRVAP